MPYQIASADTVDRANRRGGAFKMVTPSYFQALGIDLAAGRALHATDVAGSPPVMVVNETLAKRDFPNVSAIGQRTSCRKSCPARPH